MKKYLLFLFFLSTSLAFSQLRKVKDIWPGATSSNLNHFVEYAGKLFFAADDGTNGNELWSTDGSTQNTIMVKDIRTTLGFGSLPNNLTVANGLLFFTASDGGQAQLFVTAGDEMSTIKLTTTQITSPSHLFGTANSLYFRGRSEVLDGFELWKSDGTSIGSVMITDLTPGGGQNSDVCCFQEFNNKVYFRANTTLQGSPDTGFELFSTDGTAANTELVVDIWAGTGDGDPNQLFTFNNKLYFSAHHPDFGRELFSVTTTGTLGLLKDILIGTSGSVPSEIYIHNGAIYFSASDGLNNNGRELWISNGFSTGTLLLKDINPATVGQIDGDPKRFTSVGNDLFFVAMDNINGYELWKTDGTTAGTVMIKDINSTGSSDPQELTDYNGKLYFTADDGVNGRELWISDGTEAGTQMVVELLVGSANSDIKNLIVFQNELYFAGNDNVDGQELWAYRDPTLSLKNTDINTYNLFPNPTKSQFSLQTNQPISEVSIYDVQGKMVKAFSSQLETYDINGLTSGIYFVNIITNEGQITKKLIKQ